MTQSATDIVRDVINAAIVDAIVALKDASQGLPNALMRDLAAIHANTAFGDLPLAVQKAVAFSVRDAFSKLQKNGYVVAEAKSVLSAAPRPASRVDPDRDRNPRRGFKKPGGPRTPPSGGRR